MVTLVCRPRESGDPVLSFNRLDSRLRGNERRMLISLDQAPAMSLECIPFNVDRGDNVPCNEHAALQDSERVSLALPVTRQLCDQLAILCNCKTAAGAFNLFDQRETF